MTEAELAKFKAGLDLAEKGDRAGSIKALEISECGIEDKSLIIFFFAFLSTFPHYTSLSQTRGVAVLPEHQGSISARRGTLPCFVDLACLEQDRAGFSPGAT